jgi:hypothetical protein
MITLTSPQMEDDDSGEFRTFDKAMMLGFGLARQELNKVVVPPSTSSSESAQWDAESTNENKQSNHTIRECLKTWGADAVVADNLRRVREKERGISINHRDGCKDEAMCRGGIACMSVTEPLTMQWVDLFEGWGKVVRMGVMSFLCHNESLPSNLTDILPGSVTMLEKSELIRYGSTHSGSDTNITHWELFLERLLIVWSMLGDGVGRHLWLTRFYVHDHFAGTTWTSTKFKNLERAWAGFTILIKVPLLSPFFLLVIFPMDRPRFLLLIVFTILSLFVFCPHQIVQTYMFRYSYSSVSQVNSTAMAAKGASMKDSDSSENSSQQQKVPLL